MANIIITTSRLTLQPLGIKYLESTHEYASDLENTRYMIHLPNETREETMQFLNMVEDNWNQTEQTTYEFALILNQQHIGAVSLYIDDQSVGELGWIVNKKYWNQGYATEAAQALLDYANKTLGVRHFIAHCDSENIGSYRIMEKLGMVCTEKTYGRKNKASNEEREELMFEYVVPE